jgi:serine protease
MRKIYFRATVLLFCSFGLTGIHLAQNFNIHYQDGKVWFLLKDDYLKVASAPDENPANLPLGRLSFLAALEGPYSITRLSLPFVAAKNSPVLTRTYLVEFSNIHEVEGLIAALKSSGAVEYAEKVPLDRPFLVPNDPGYSSQWALTKILAGSAWDYYSSGSNITVAIVDDAVQRTHPDLQPNLWVNTGEISGNGIDDDGNGYVDDINGFNVASGNNNPNPPSNSFDHGTHVAGIASAASNNSAGIASIGFSCKLMCVRATTSPGVITHGYDGILYAALSGARIVNMSWGGPSFSQTAENVVNYAYSLGSFLVAERQCNDSVLSCRIQQRIGSGINSQQRFQIGILQLWNLDRYFRSGQQYLQHNGGKLVWQ